MTEYVYRCECGASERCADPPLGTSDADVRAFYALHPLRRGAGQSWRSREADAHLAREAAARRGQR